MTLTYTYKDLEDILDKKEIEYTEERLGDVFGLRIYCGENGGKYIKAECIEFFQNLFSKIPVLVGSIPYTDFVYVKLLK